jgi:hypothetical protein
VVSTQSTTRYQYYIFFFFFFFESKTDILFSLTAEGYLGVVVGSCTSLIDQCWSIRLVNLHKPITRAYTAFYL